MSMSMSMNMSFLEHLLAFGGIALLVGSGLVLTLAFLAFKGWMDSGSH